jgi:hypothetical protein
MKYANIVWVMMCLSTGCAYSDRTIGQEGRTSLNPQAAPGRLSSGNWIDKISQYVSVEKAVYKEGNYDLYFSDLRLAKDARERGDWAGQYQAMNRFIDKLDSRAGSIPEKAAREIREYAYLVEPWGYHDLARDRKIHPEVKKWEERRDRQFEEVQTPQAS